MGVRYVKDFEFPSAAGYSKSMPSKVTGQMYAKGGHVKKKYADGGGVTGPYDINNMEQAPSEVGKGAVEGAQAGALSPQMRQKLLMLQAAKRRAMMQQQAAQDTRMNDVPPGANYDQGQMDRAERGYKKGGKVAKVMHEFGEGKLHSGSKKGPKVTNPKQAVAIALSEAGKSKKGYAEGGMKAEHGVPLPSVDDASPTKRMFEVYDGQTGDVVGTYGSLKAASRAVDRRDNEYGGYRYRYRPVGGYAKGGNVKHEDVAADKSLIKSMVKPTALKKADGGPIPPQIRSPLQDMARARSVPVAPRAPMIPQQAAPAGGGPKIGVGVSRPGKPNVGAIRAAMARKASQVMPENAPSMMKKGGKVGC